MATSKKATGTKTNVRKISDYVVKTFPQIPNVWGYATSADHNTRKCVDFMVVGSKIGPADAKILGNKIADWFIDQHNAGNLSLEFMVWRGRAWRPKANEYGPKGWGNYHAPSTHFDHVHVQLGDWFKQPAPLKETVMYVTRDIKGYGLFSTGSRVTVRRKKGFRLTGTIVTLSDGKYLKTKFGTHYPMDSLSTKKP